MKILLLLAAVLGTGIHGALSTPQWTFNLKNESSGIVALESIVVSPTLAIFFDRASDDPLQINGHSAWGALWNLETSTVTPLDVLTNAICASGALLSNGTMVGIHSHNVTSCAHSMTACRLVSAETRTASRAILSSNLGLRLSVSSSHVRLQPAKAALCSRTLAPSIYLTIDGMPRRSVSSMEALSLLVACMRPQHSTTLIPP